MNHLGMLLAMKLVALKYFEFFLILLVLKIHPIADVLSANARMTSSVRPCLRHSLISNFSVIASAINSRTLLALLLALN